MSHMTTYIVRQFSSFKIIFRERRRPTINASLSVYIMGTLCYRLWVIILNKVQFGNYTLA